MSAATAARPKLEALRVADLRMDPSVQRSRIDEAWVKHLVANWDDDKAQEIKVSRRADGDYVLDGAHRVTALRRLGRDDYKIVSIVRVYDSLAHEATAFVAKNAEVRRPHPIDIYRVQLVAEDPTVVAVDKVLTDHGLHVGWGSAQGDTVSAVSALRWIHRLGGERLLGDVFDVTAGAWGNDDGYRHADGIIKGVAIVLDRVGDQLDRNSLAHKLGATTNPTTLLGDGRVLANAWSKALPYAVAEKIVSIYNKGKSSRKVTL